ncbi:stress response translation initiation inhibitor YciH [archaeon]|nr:stress response translation initiation inhibitor YciH [archaeon]
MNVCPKCGLPKELCTCSQIVMEGQEVKVSTTKRRYGKPVTLIKGINFEELGDNETKELIRSLKRELACGGTFDKEEQVIELQGSHVNKVKRFLQKKGYKVEGYAGKKTKLNREKS